MSNFRFTIPLNRDDLLKKPSLKHYHVSEILSIRELPTALHAFKRAIPNVGCLSVLENFPPVYSAIMRFSEIEIETKSESWQITLKAALRLKDDVEKYIDSLGEENPSSQDDEKQSYQNATKMICYLLCNLMDCFQTQKLKRSALATPRVRGRGKKTVRIHESTGSDESELISKWDSWRRDGLLAILQIIRLNLYRLWDSPTVGDDFVTLIHTTAYKMLEDISVCKHKEDRDLVFHILGVLVKRYGHNISCGVKLVQLLQSFEHLAPHFAVCMEIFVKEYGLHSILGDCMREISRIDSRELARDTGGTRSLGVFLTDCAERLPTVLHANISLLLCHLEGESPTIRNAVLCCFAEIIIRVLSSKETEQLEQHHRDSRDTLLQYLLNHLHDTHSFVRCKALQKFLSIIAEDALPLSYREDLLRITVGRLLDKSSLVRKFAIQVVTALLKANSVTIQLSYEDVQNNLETEQKKLADLVEQKKLERAARAKAHSKENENKESQSSKEDGNESEDEVMDSDEEGDGEVPSSENEVSPDVHDIVEQSDEEPDDEDVVKQKCIIEFLMKCIDFHKAVKLCIPIIAQLLGSKTSSDVIDAIEFFINAFELGVPNSMLGVRRMLVLVWSQEAAIRNAVVLAYTRLYLPDENTPRRARSVVDNLTALLADSTLGQLTSLEHMMEEFVRSGSLGKDVIQHLWMRFTHKLDDISDPESHAALILLSMAAGAEPDIIRSNIDILVSEGLGERGRKAFPLVRDTCQALMKMALVNEKPLPGVYPEPIRLPKDHTIFSSLAEILVETIDDTKQDTWTPMMEQAINLIYRLSENPDSILGPILTKISGKLFVKKPDSSMNQDGNEIDLSETTDTCGIQCSSVVLSRFLALVGHIAMSQMVHLEQSVFCELKRRQAILEEKNNEKGAKKSPKKLRRTTVSRSSLEMSHLQESTLTSLMESSREPGEDELVGMMGAAADDAEWEFIQGISENNIVTGSGLIAQFVPLILAIVSRETPSTDPHLSVSAALALAKCMLVSSQLCERHLRLLFTLMDQNCNTQNDTLRANIIIAMGNLTYRFPNRIEPWTPNFYAALRDNSVGVRKNAVLVLSHLILHDMVKVKGQISEMARCLMDNETQVALLARHFFDELARKGNSIYNILADIISRLCDPSEEMPEADFKEIMRILFSYIQKDRQCESLVEKLCQRMRCTKADSQWHHLSYCLTLINSYNERCVQKLNENFTCFADKLFDDGVFAHFMTIIAGARKAAKPEFMATVDELEQNINRFHRKGVDQSEILEVAKTLSPARRSLGSATPASVTRSARGRGKSFSQRMDQSRVQPPSSTDSDEEPPLISTRMTRNRKKQQVSEPRNKKKALAVIDDSDEEFKR